MAREARKNDYVEVKEGIKDTHFNKYNIGGWKGFVSKVVENEKSNTANILTVNWDIKTLEDFLSDEFIEESISTEKSFSEMNLNANNVIVRPKPRKENKKKREEVILNLKYSLMPSKLDEQDELFIEILSSEDLEVSYKNLETYRNFLLKKLKEPVVMTGIEDFSWEARFVFGYGSEAEYREMKKTRPSYTDTFTLLEILDADTFEQDLIAKVRRKSDQKIFEIPLSELEAIDENSDNYGFLHDFSCWVVNYQ